MKLEKKFLRSRVARRMLGFFMLSAFIPVLFLAFLAYWESNRLLVQQAHSRLDAASNIYRTSIYDRLLLSDQLLKDVIPGLSNDKVADIEEQLNNQFRSVAVQLPIGRTIPLWGEKSEVIVLDASAVEHLFNEKPLLITQQSGQDIKIFVVRARNPLVRESGIVIAEIIPDYLWGDVDAFALDMNICVYNENNIQMFCTHSHIYPATQNIQEQARTTKGDFTWQENEEKYIANYHEVFLQAKFLTPRWIVVATQPETDALDSMKKFNTIFWGSVILSVLLILLLSMTQIRRVLVPLEQLIDGTRRLGSHDFTTKVAVTSSDEFGELAKSFNIMSDQLGDQFETLAALSKIDREILSTLDIEKIANEVLLHLQKTTQAHFASISVINNDSAGEIHSYAIDPESRQLCSQPHALLHNIAKLK